MISPEAATLLKRFEPYIVPEGRTFQEVEPVLNKLILPYQVEPWRGHHTVNHLGDMADFLVPRVDTLENPRGVLLGVLGHDWAYQPWLYDPRLLVKGVNEKISSYVTRLLATPQYEDGDVDHACNIIDATASHDPDVKDSDTKYALDSDMLIVGADEEKFDIYDANTIDEYLWGGFWTRKQVLMGRVAVLGGFDARRIFCTQYAQDMYEAQAHNNIKRSIARCTSELAQL